MRFTVRAVYRPRVPALRRRLATTLALAFAARVALVARAAHVASAALVARFARAARTAVVAFVGVVVLVTPAAARAGAAAPAGSVAPAVHHPVSTRVAGAQTEFDRGLELMYAFAPEEALAHFQAAGQLDPTCAMAYWGIALSAGPNVNVPYDVARAEVGRAASAQAASLARGASPEERDLIAAIALRYDARSDSEAARAQAAYAGAMDAAARRYPHDPDVLALAAESLMDLQPLAMWRHDGGPQQHTLRTVELLTQALRIDPGHVGANHFMIHAFERSPTPQRALASARRLAALHLAPQEEHLAHMPAHIFLRLGMYDDAIGAGERSVALFRDLLKVPHAAQHDGYFHHDLQVLEAAYQMAGRSQRAIDVANEVASQVADSEASVEAYERFGRWREILALATPERPGPRWHLARGLAANATNDDAAASSESAYFHGLRGDDARLTIARDLLDAARARRARDDARAIVLLRDAVRAQDSLDLTEPPKWFFPVRESLGAAYVRTGRYADAERTFRDDLARNPDNPRSLFGLATTLARERSPRARAARERFEQHWHGADTRPSIDSL